MNDRELLQEALDTLITHQKLTRPLQITDYTIKKLQEALAQPKPWIGLTDEEIKGILDCGRGGLVDIKKAEQILKEKNT